jgi:putative membrane protein
MGWMWLSGLPMLAAIAVLIVLLVRLLGVNRDGPSGRGTARQILDERFAGGELAAQQYREQLKILGEGTWWRRSVGARPCCWVAGGRLRQRSAGRAWCGA